MYHACFTAKQGGACFQPSRHGAQYKDVTFETLNKSDFLSLILEAFPAVNWEKAYEDFLAAGEKKE